MWSNFIFQDRPLSARERRRLRQSQESASGPGTCFFTELQPERYSLMHIKKIVQLLRRIKESYENEESRCS